MKMALTRIQLIGIIAVAAVVTTTVGIMVVVDPFTPRYTLTIYDPSYIACSDYANVTITPPGVKGDISPLSYEFKANTVVELTISFSNSAAIDFLGWTGPDASLVQTITAGQTYKISMSGNISITATWNSHC
jgi:hypothetical protein